MLPHIDVALDKLVDQRVIEPVTHSDWAAHIVPVLKSDKKTVRICGDFSVTINSAAKLDSYPIPHIVNWGYLGRGPIWVKLQNVLQMGVDWPK